MSFNINILKIIFYSNLYFTIIQLCSPYLRIIRICIYKLHFIRIWSFVCETFSFLSAQQRVAARDASAELGTRAGAIGDMGESAPMGCWREDGLKLPDTDSAYCGGYSRQPNQQTRNDESFVHNGSAQGADKKRMRVFLRGLSGSAQVPPSGDTRCAAGSRGGSQGFSQCAGGIPKRQPQPRARADRACVRRIPAVRSSPVAPSPVRA